MNESDAPFHPSHTIPEGGLACWATPDPTREPVRTAAAGLPVEVTERRGAWANVRFSNGWSAWVDGRRLAGGAEPAAVPQTPTAPAGRAPAEPTPAVSPTPTTSAAPRVAPVQPAPSPAPTAPGPPITLGGVRITGSLVGGVAVAASSFFPWVTLGGAPSSSAFKIPAAFLVDRAADPGGLKLGYLLLVLGGAAVAAAFKATRPVRRAIAAATALVIAAFVVQLQRAVGGAQAASVLAHLGFGVLLAAGGAFCVWTGRSAGEGES